MIDTKKEQQEMKPLNMHYYQMKKRNRQEKIW